MFIDYARIYIKAGNGGDGVVSFHREKYVAAGGPDGGDGGNGGDIIMVASDRIRTLIDFKYKRKFAAESGENGKSSNRTGKSGKNLVINIPVGTIVKNADTGKLLFDFTENGQTEIIARGGKGGAGNQHFATPTRQVPEFAKAGEEGEALWVELELKMLADAGLVGFPNVGKSTILSMVSAARPKIADYHFTTLEPSIGVVRIDEEKSFVMADIPGLIEGAHEGAGLGHQFLKHIERTRLLVHVIDVAGSEGRDPLTDFEKINNELFKYSKILAGKPQIVAANKIDLTDGPELYKIVKEELGKRGYEVYPISAATGQGIKELKGRIAQLIAELPPILTYEADEEPEIIGLDDEPIYEIAVENNVYNVTGKWIQKLVKSTNMYNYESLQYFQRLIRRKGLIDELERLGIKEGDTVKIYDMEFEYKK